MKVQLPVAAVVAMDNDACCSGNTWMNTEDSFLASAFKKTRMMKIITIVPILLIVVQSVMAGRMPDSQGIVWTTNNSGGYDSYTGKMKIYYKLVDVSNATERSNMRIVIPETFSDPENARYEILTGMLIRNGAFLNCKGMSELVVPSTVTEIEGGALNCKESLLTNISVHAGNPYYSSKNGLLLSKDGKQLIQGVNGNVRIPEQVTEIGYSAFAYCTNLTSISFGEAVPIIDSQAFYNINKSCICRVPFKGSWRYKEGIPGVWNGLNTDYDVCIVRLFPNNGTIELGDNTIQTLSSYVMLTNGGLIGSLPVAQRVGYTFLGWFDNYGDEIIPGALLTSSVKAYAQWIANRYNASFNANGGVVAEGEIDRYVVYDSPYGQLPMPSRIGYSFTGWLLNGSKMTSQTIVKTTSDHTLVASWTPNQYMVSYDANGGSVSGSTSKNVTFDSTYGSLPTPKRIGYTFAGWTLDGMPISADMVVSTAGDHTLVAEWTINQYNVTFDANGGIGGYEVVQDYGTDVVPPIVTREGCTFEGWMPSVVATVPASNATYKAKWKVWSATVDSTAQSIRALYPNDYANITNVAFAVGVTNIPQGFFDGCSSIKIVSISESVFDIADYVFAGCENLQAELWGGYKVLDGWLIGYTDEAGATVPDADKLKGICSEALRGCTALRRLVFSDDSRLVSIGAEALKGCTELKTLVLPPSLTRIGDEAFMGCSYLDNVIVPGSVKSIGNGAFKNCTGFTSAQIGHGVESIGQEAFYGCWRITEVDIPSSVSSIRVDAFGGDSSITKVALRGDIRKVSEIFSNCRQITEATVKSGTGEIVDGLFSGCRSLGTVRFLGNCPALANDGENLYGNTPSGSWGGLVTYVDKASTGWDGTPGSHVLPMMWPLVGGNRREIRYADAIIVPVSVTFDANGGTPKTQKIAQRSEEAFVLPSVPKRDDNTFDGWWTEKVGGVRVTADTIFINGVYSILYAHWNPVICTITLNANGGALGAGVANKVSVAKNVALGANALPKPTWKGYTFKGWYTKKSGGTKITAKTKVTKSVTYYAQWTANKYTIKFNANGGKGSMKALAATYGKTVALRANAFKRTNWTFLGWAKTKGAAEVEYKNKQKVKNLSEKSGGTVTLYAVWRRNTYMVNFSANGGTGEPLTQTMNCGSKTALATNGFTRAGFRFAGWATKKGGKVVYRNAAAVKDLAKSGKSATLYAVWYPEKWAVGTFKGKGKIGGKAATVTLTVASDGKISGKFVRKSDKKSFAFKADGFKEFKDGALRVTTTLKYGTKTCSVVIAVGQDGETGETIQEIALMYNDALYGWGFVEP